MKKRILQKVRNSSATTNYHHASSQPATSSLLEWQYSIAKEEEQKLIQKRTRKEAESGSENEFEKILALQQRELKNLLKCRCDGSQLLLLSRRVTGPGECDLNGNYIEKSTYSLVKRVSSSASFEPISPKTEHQNQLQNHQQHLQPLFYHHLSVNCSSLPNSPTTSSKTSTSGSTTSTSFLIFNSFNSSSSNSSSSNSFYYSILQLLCPELGCLWFGSTELGLERHLLFGHRLQPNRCPVGGCDHSFHTLTQLHAHIKWKHVVAGHTLPLQCRSCPRLFLHHTPLVGHYRDAHHLQGTFQCACCQVATFENREKVLDHHQKCQLWFGNL